MTGGQKVFGIALAFFCVAVGAQNLDSEVSLKNEYHLQPLTGEGPAILECRLQNNGALKCATNLLLRSVQCKDITREPMRDLKTFIKAEAFSCDLLPSDSRFTNVWQMTLEGQDGSVSEWRVEGVRSTQLEKAFRSEMDFERRDPRLWVDSFEASLVGGGSDSLVQQSHYYGAALTAQKDLFEGNVEIRQNHINARTGHLPDSLLSGIAFFAQSNTDFQVGPQLTARWDGSSGVRHFGPEVAAILRYKVFSFLRLDLRVAGYWPKVDKFKKSYSGLVGLRLGEFFSTWVVRAEGGLQQQEWQDHETWKNSGGLFRAELSYHY